MKSMAWPPGEGLVRWILGCVMRGTIGAGRSGGRRCAAPALIGAWVGTFATLLIASPAWADCGPNSASAVSGQTVNCTGIAPTGFQAGAGVNTLTVNVQSGATVQDNGAVAIGVNNGNTVTNNAGITAGAPANGIASGDSNIIANSGTIAAGDSGTGILVNNNSK